MKYRIFFVFFVGLLSFTTQTSHLFSEETTLIRSSKAEELYFSLNANNFELPELKSFEKAVEGYTRFKEKGAIKKDFLTLIDFSLSSNNKRLWVIDMKNKTILFHSLVAHGRNTGNEFAQHFSNKPESHQSSLGFYTTAETYFGKHGYSLRLDGLEKGINSNARDRAIVIHGADYVSDHFIQQQGRLGRSFGCPSLPEELSKEIIDTIKDKSCLFIYHPKIL